MPGFPVASQKKAEFSAKSVQLRSGKVIFTQPVTYSGVFSS